MLDVCENINAEIFSEINMLWRLTGVGNPARGDSLESILNTLKYDGKIFTLFEQAKLIACCWITCDGRRLYLHHMAVLPEHQNKGIGTILINKALSYAHDMQLQIKLEVHVHNMPAKYLYEKYGFELLDGYLSMIKRKI